MRLFSSEVAHNYDTYTFAYAQYAEREEGEPLDGIYAHGFLPYSGVRDAQNLFYMARSARIPLSHWELTSENRRIARKFDGEFEREKIPLSAFEKDEAFYAFCLGYFSKRHGERAMPRERLEFILACGLVSAVVVYRKDGAMVAYAFEVEDGGVGHYWFSFYDLSLVRQSLGLWIMLDCARHAKEAGLAHYYLGTVYGEKALYKNNFEPLQWWDGTCWQDDMKLLRERARTDEARALPPMDAWKEGKSFFGG